MYKKIIYQILASPTGWADAKPLLIEVYSHEQAMIMLYGFAVMFNTEVRGAIVTDYDNLIERNNNGERLGNGIYVYPKQTDWYLKRQFNGETKY